LSVIFLMKNIYYYYY